LLGYALAQKITEWTVAKRRAFTARIGLPENARIPILCVWAAGDEVLSWFQFFDSIAELPHLFLAPVALIIILLAFCGLHLSGIVPINLPGFSHLARDLLQSGAMANTVAVSNELEEQRRVFLGLCLITALLNTMLAALALTAVGLILNLPFRIMSMGIPLTDLAENALVRIAFTPIPTNSHLVSSVTSKQTPAFSVIRKPIMTPRR
jgi:hypothetical protein